MTETRKKLLLAGLAALALLAGIWLAISPTLEHQRMRAYQDALQKSVESGDGTITIHETIKRADMDFYTGPDPGGDGLLLAMPPGDTHTEAMPKQADTIHGIGILSIEKISLEVPVTAGATDANLKISEGWVEQTAPIGGTGNAVIAGHRSYTYGQHFNRLGELAEGDEIRYTPKDGEELTFSVCEVLTIEPGDPTAFEQPDDQSMLTLYTCTPIRTATHRLLVRALRVE